MILFKKVVFLKNIVINKSPWLHTLKIHTIYKSLVEIGQKFMEVSLNHIDFADFFDKEMLTSSFPFPSTNFQNFFDRQYWFRDINAMDLKNFRIQVRNTKFLREHVILMDPVIFVFISKVTS